MQTLHILFLLFLALTKCSCLPGTSLLRILDSINEGDNAGKISKIIGDKFIFCNSSSSIVIEKAILLNRSESLHVILGSTVMMSESEKTGLIECAIHSHSLESLMVMSRYGFIYRQMSRDRRCISAGKALWCSSSCGWSYDDIQTLAKYPGFQNLIGSFRTLLGIRSPDIACLLCRLMIENSFKSPESILWFIACNKLRHLDDAGISQVLRLLLSYPFLSPRTLWISHQLLWQFVRTHEDAIQSLSLILQDPRFLLKRSRSLPESSCADFLRRFGKFIRMCKNGEHDRLRSALLESRLSSRALEMMLKSSLRCCRPLCFQVTLSHISGIFISNLLADGKDHELLSIAESGLQKMVQLHKLGLQQTSQLPFDIIRYINHFMLRLTLEQINKFTI